MKTAEELFLEKYGNKITASESWVIRFAEEYKNQYTPPVGIFKHGDKITLNTGCGCDKGEVLVDCGWKNK